MSKESELGERMTEEDAYRSIFGLTCIERAVRDSLARAEYYNLLADALEEHPELSVAEVLALLEKSACTA